MHCFSPSKVTFFTELKVQRSLNFFFSATVYYRFRGCIWKHGEIEWCRKLDFQAGLTSRSVLSSPHLPSLKHKTHHSEKPARRQFLIQKWLFKTCHPLTVWLPAPEGKEVKKKKKKKIDRQMQNLTKETRMQCLNWILCGGRQVSLETNNLSWETVENERNGKGVGGFLTHPKWARGTVLYSWIRTRIQAAFSSSPKMKTPIVAMASWCGKFF